MVLGTESDITELIDRFYRQEFNHKAVYQLLARSPKESAARAPSQIMVGYLGFALLWSLAFDWNTLAFNYNPQPFFLPLFFQAYS